VKAPRKGAFLLKIIHYLFKTETWEGDISEFEKYINTKEEADFEGIWDIDGVYKIGIIKEGINFVGFIIESSVDTWQPKLVKLKIEKFDEQVKTTYYMRDHSPVTSDNPKLFDDNHLQIGQHTLKRLKPIFAPDRLSKIISNL